MSFSQKYNVSLIRLNLLLLLGALSMMFVGCSSEDEFVGLKKGSEVAKFSVASTDGQIVTEETLKGEIYLLSFFNTGCSDCQQELPVLQKAYEKYRYDIRFVNISRDEDEASVSSYWQKNSFTMPYYAPGNRDIYNSFASSGIPRIYLVDGNGVIVAAFDDTSMPSLDQLSECIENAMDESDKYSEVTIKACVKKAVSSTNSDDNFYFYNEYAVNKLWGFFYDSQTKKLVKAAMISQLTKKDDEAGMTYDISYITNTLTLKSGYYDVFFVANTDYPPLDIEDEDEFLDTQDSLSYSDGILSSISDQGAIMTNVASEHINIDFASEAKRHSTLSINLERVMSKVRIGCNKEKYELMHDGEEYAEVNLTNYRLINLNKNYYLFRHTTSSNSTDRPKAYTLGDNFQQDDANFKYVVDPYFYDKQPNESSYDFMATKYAYAYKNFRLGGMAPMPAPNNYGAAYILENTSHASAQKNAYSVGVVFKGAVNPNFVYLYDATTHQLQTEKRIEYWPKTLYLYNYQFYGSLRALNVGTNLNIDELKTYTDQELAEYGIKQTHFNMGVYETFYVYWIRHEDESQWLSPMKYAIVRNNFYQLFVSDISELGSSEITPNLALDNE